MLLYRVSLSVFFLLYFFLHLYCCILDLNFQSFCWQMHISLNSVKIQFHGWFACHVFHFCEYEYWIYVYCALFTFIFSEKLWLCSHLSGSSIVAQLCIPLPTKKMLKKCVWLHQSKSFPHLWVFTMENGEKFKWHLTPLLETIFTSILNLWSSWFILCDFSFTPSKTSRCFVNAKMCSSAWKIHFLLVTNSCCALCTIHACCIEMFISFFYRFHLWFSQNCL